MINTTNETGKEMIDVSGPIIPNNNTISIEIKPETILIITARLDNLYLNEPIIDGTKLKPIPDKARPTEIIF